MNVDKMKEWALAIIEDLMEDSANFHDFVAWRETDKWYTFKKEVRENENCMLQTWNGISKAVITYPYLPFVIKIPLEVDDHRLARKEVEISERVRGGDIEEMFAHAYMIENIYNVPIYIMEKVELDSDKVCSSVANSEYCCDTYVSDLPYNETEMLVGIFEGYYDYEQIQSFLDYCAQVDISDFHDENIGFIGDRPVVIDYSGC